MLKLQLAQQNQVLFHALEEHSSVDNGVHTQSACFPIALKQVLPKSATLWEERGFVLLGF